MLGLFQNLIRPSGGVVLPGGILSDGDWVKMIVAPAGRWAQVGSTNWEDWNLAAES
tara:strand:+ start:293 stop:460 length:168 start_codon:yes stop_codon:yes gene_type:complete